MPSGSPPLRERYAEDLRSGSLPVVVTAVVIALVAGVGGAAVTDEWAVGFLLALLVGVQLPTGHEQYEPQGQPWTRDVGWTVGAAAAAIGLFAAGYLLVGQVLDDPVLESVVAYLLATVTGWQVLRRR